MKPMKQTILHDPSNGQHGNCLSAVLASLLHLPIETVPVFSDTDHWLKDLNAWLRPHGLAYLSFPDPAFNLTLSNFGIIGLHHEIGGMSTRWKDVGHSCVAEDGLVMFDPHPSNDGLNAGVESSGIFVALEPWKWAGKAPEQPVAPQVIRDHLFIESRQDGAWLVCLGGVYDSENDARKACEGWKQSAHARVTEMVNRFLCWPVPKYFDPDCGISFDGRKDDEWNKNKSWPTGTNLFTAEQAKEMFEHVLSAAPAQPSVNQAEALYKEANEVFNSNPSETSQDVRDVIEWFYGSMQAAPAQPACSECGKTNTTDSQWAAYCVECWEKTLPPVPKGFKLVPDDAACLWTDGVEHPTADVDAMVNRFLGWKLPKDFAPDCFISFQAERADQYNAWPIGTNLLTAEQARDMFEHVLSAAPTAPAHSSDFDIRGLLASKLTCWHRLTEQESAELVAFVSAYGIKVTP